MTESESVIFLKIKTLSWKLQTYLFSVFGPWVHGGQARVGVNFFGAHWTVQLDQTCRHIEIRRKFGIEAEPTLTEIGSDAHWSNLDLRQSLTLGGLTAVIYRPVNYRNLPGFLDYRYRYLSQNYRNLPFLNKCDF